MKRDADMTVQELIEHHPETIRYFLHHKMQCVGCPTEAFHTLNEVAHIQGISTDGLIEGLAQSIAKTEISPSIEDD